MIFAILLTISQLLSANETSTFKIRSTKVVAPLFTERLRNHTTRVDRAYVMGQLTIHSKKYGDHVVLYDDEDHDLISKHNWYLDKVIQGRHNLVYASTWMHNKNIRMHRLLLNFPNCKVDHRNGNGLNNCRYNLRLSTDSQNSMNTGKRTNNTSGYKGVHFRKDNKKYVAHITSNYKRHHLGCFHTARQAAIAYNQASLQYHGEFAYQNKL